VSRDGNPYAGRVTDLADRAQWIADTVLFPDAAMVDSAGVVPESHFRALASAGLYGLAAPPEVGGPGAGLDTIVPVLETLAGGCLSTTFVWIQHHGAVRGLAATPNAPLREEFLDDLIVGRKRSGVAFAGAAAVPARLHASKVGGGWVFEGSGPFVSGWGIVDVLHVSGRAGDEIVNVLIDAKTAPGLVASPYELVVAQATATVQLKFSEFFVPDDRVVGTVSTDQFLVAELFSSRLNGCLPIGLAVRCAQLLDEYGKPEAASAVTEQITSVRADLDAGLADPDAMPAARAAASALAYRAAGAVVVAEGAGGVIVGGHGQRLVREAMFTLVAGSRPPMKAALLDVLSGG
jgi:alkylation response protein AidB-like acyl-CoA dehydrogenase